MPQSCLAAGRSRSDPRARCSASARTLATRAWMRARRLADLRNRRLALAAFQSLRSEYSDHDSAGVRSCATRPTAYSPSNNASAGGPSSGPTASPTPGHSRSSAPTAWRQNRTGSLSATSSDSQATGWPPHRAPWAAGPSSRTRPTRKPGTAAGPARPPAPVPVAGAARTPVAGRAGSASWPAGHPARKRRPRPEPPQMAQPSMTYRSARPAMASSAAGCSQSNGQLTAAAPPARVRPARPGHCPRPRLPGRLPAGARTAAMGLVRPAGDQPPAQMADHRRADPPRPGAAPIRRGRIAARQCRDASPEDSTRMGTFG